MSELTAFVLLDGESIQRWARRAVEIAVEEHDIEITHIIINDDYREGGQSVSITRHLNSIKEYRWWTPYAAWQTVISPPGYLQDEDLDDVRVFDGAERILCSPQAAEPFGNKLPSEAVNTVSTCDIGFRFGFGIILGDVLSEPENGLLSYHHGDVREYRGRPSGVWEFLHGKDTGGATVQQLTPTLDGGKIAAFRPIDIRDCQTWQEVKRKQFCRSLDLLAEAVGNVTDPNVTIEPPDKLGPLYSIPTLSDTIKIAIKNQIR